MMDEPPLDLFEGLTAEVAERLIREELPETSLFGLRFRQNAAQGALAAAPGPAKRTPLWLQRLRAKDLLQIARQIPDFPIVLETVRECLDDDLELPRLRALLDAIQLGRGDRSQAARGDPVALHVGADLSVHRGPSVRVGRAEAQRPASLPARFSAIFRSIRSCAATPRVTGSIRRRSAASRIACATTECRRGPSMRWPND